MKFLKLIPVLFILFGNFPYKNVLYAELKNPKDYKVLANNKKPDVAVPLLVETIRIMSPNSPEGKEAYKTLMQLGFVETSYKG